MRAHPIGARLRMFVNSVKKTVKNRHGAFIMPSRLWYDLSDYLAELRNRLFNRLWPLIVS